MGEPPEQLEAINPAMLNRLMKVQMGSAFH